MVPMPSQAWAKRGGGGGGGVSVRKHQDIMYTRRAFQFPVLGRANGQIYSMLSLKSVIGFTGEQTRPIAHFTPRPKNY
eukprot:scaffold23870_cov43-Cyclotella_meneghiniana.AAC.1